MYFIHHFCRLFFGMSSLSVTFPLRMGDSVSAVSLTENLRLEEAPQSFLLVNSNLCHDNVGITHEITVHCFRAADGQLYHITADRTQPLPPEAGDQAVDTRPAPSRHARSSGDIVNQVSTSFSKKEARDRICHFTPTRLLFQADISKTCLCSRDPGELGAAGIKTCLQEFTRSTLPSGLGAPGAPGAREHVL